jgi:hypothetical protein
MTANAALFVALVAIAVARVRDDGEVVTRPPA